MKNTLLSMIIILLSLLLFTACSQKSEIKKQNKEELLEIKDYTKAKLERISFEEIKDFEDDNLDLALEVFKKDCVKSKKNKLLRNVCIQSIEYTNGKEFFTKYFTPYILNNKLNNNLGLITGYYEPLLYGSRIKTDKYRYAVYKTPHDLVSVNLGLFKKKLKGKKIKGKVIKSRLVPYDERALILQRNDLDAICYVDSKIDLFFLQIQGSGKVQFESGEVINVGYSSQNGRKYYAIGKEFVKNGLIPRKDISLQSIKKYLLEHPQEVDRILNLNKSFVFFIENENSATGALGVPLVAKRNIAVDKSYIPLGFPVFINTKNPKTKEDINQLVIAADVGGAIKGEIRADFFFGNGSEAEELAGTMKEKGKLILLIPSI